LQKKFGDIFYQYKVLTIFICKILSFILTHSNFLDSLEIYDLESFANNLKAGQDKTKVKET